MSASTSGTSAPQDNNGDRFVEDITKLATKLEGTVQNLRTAAEEAVRPSPWWKKVVDVIVPTIIIGAAFLIGSKFMPKQDVSTKQDDTLVYYDTGIHHHHYHSGLHIALFNDNGSKEDGGFPIGNIAIDCPPYQRSK